MGADDEVAAVVKQPDLQNFGRKHPLHPDGCGAAPEQVSESPAGSQTGAAVAAGPALEEASHQPVADDSVEDDDSAASDDALQEALARTVNRASAQALYVPSS